LDTRVSVRLDDGVRYGGSVSRVFRGGAFAVVFDDDTEEAVACDDPDLELGGDDDPPASAAAHSPGPPVTRVGARVTVRFNDGVRYGGSVSRVFGAGALFVAYDDGTEDVVACDDPDLVLYGRAVVVKSEEEDAEATTVETVTARLLAVCADLGVRGGGEAASGLFATAGDRSALVRALEALVGVRGWCRRGGGDAAQAELFKTALVAVRQLRCVLDEACELAPQRLVVLDQEYRDGPVDGEPSALAGSGGGCVASITNCEDETKKALKALPATRARGPGAGPRPRPILVAPNAHVEVGRLPCFPLLRVAGGRRPRSCLAPFSTASAPRG